MKHLGYYILLVPLALLLAACGGERGAHSSGPPQPSPEGKCSIALSNLIKQEYFSQARQCTVGSDTSFKGLPSIDELLQDATGSSSDKDKCHEYFTNNLMVAALDSSSLAVGGNASVSYSTFGANKHSIGATYSSNISLKLTMRSAPSGPSSTVIIKRSPNCNCQQPLPPDPFGKTKYCILNMDDPAISYLTLYDLPTIKTLNREGCATPVKISPLGLSFTDYTQLNAPNFSQKLSTKSTYTDDIKIALNDEPPGTSSDPGLGTFEIKKHELCPTDPVTFLKLKDSIKLGVAYIKQSIVSPNFTIQSASGEPVWTTCRGKAELTNSAFTCSASNDDNTITVPWLARFSSTGAILNDWYTLRNLNIDAHPQIGECPSDTVHNVQHRLYLGLLKNNGDINTEDSATYSAWYGCKAVPAE